MSTNSPSDIQTRLHTLLCGELGTTDRMELLSLIARDAKTQKMLEEMIEHQQKARAAFGYDRADAAIETMWPAALQRARGTAVRQMRIAADRRHRTRQTIWRVAASVVLICSLAMALSALHRSSRMQEELSIVRQRESLPVVRVSADQLAMYRILWEQVGKGAGPWLLVSNGEGEFGSAVISPGDTVPDEVLLVSWRVLTESGQQVYAAELLFAAGASVDLDLPSNSRIAGRNGTVTVHASNGQVVMNISLHARGELPIGVTGMVPVDMTVYELGQFRMGQNMLRVCVQTQQISGSHI